jgi:polyhydroxybutyrate depolymerase
MVAAAVALVFLGLKLYYSVGSAWACNLPVQGPLQAGLTARRVLSGGRARCYLVYVPTGFRSTEPMPVVFSLHGFASTADSQEYMSDWNSVADRETALIVYGQGTSFPLRWSVVPDPSVAGVDDLQYLRDVLGELGQLATIDRTRIYVTGYSNGAALSIRAACEMADTVAAIGTVAGPYPELPGGCRPARPVPVIAFHGTADPVVRYEGGETVLSPFLAWLFNVSPHPSSYPAAPEWTGNWAAQNGCRPAPEAIPLPGDTSGVRYTGCRENADVVFYTIRDGGHTWPGGRTMDFLGKTSTAIHASTAMWEFFAAHTLPVQP